MGEAADEVRRAASPDDTELAVDVPADDADIEAQHIRQEIEQTRAEMSSTIDAIQQKLSPEVVAEQAKEAAREAVQNTVEHAKEAVREATIGKAEEVVRNVADTAQGFMGSTGSSAGGMGSSMIDTIKHNPVPAALAGIGLYLLFKNRETRSSAQWNRQGTGGGYPTTPLPYRDQGVYRPASWDQGWSGYSSGQGQGYRPGTDQGQGGGAVEQVKDVAGAAVEGAQETLGHAADRVQSAARMAGGTAGDVGSGMMETIKQNPLPAALAGISIAWLYLSRSSGSSSSSYNRASGGSYYQPSQGYSSYRPASAYKQDDGMVGQAQAAAGQALERAQSTAGQMADQVGSTAGRVAEQAQDTVVHVSDTAQYQAVRARDRFEELLEDSPLVVGAAAFALGALAGASVPQTPREHRLMGEARDTLIERAQDVAQETIDKVQHVAEGAMDSAKQEARGQGLMK
jgi:ElaB/YqjD/DUF883 family membrane-anchored ribosome-binding protein